MGLGTWIDGKLNGSILTTCESALYATMARANQDQVFCARLAEQLSTLFANLYPNLSPISSATLFRVSDALASAYPPRLEQIATKLMDVSNRMQKEGFDAPACAGGTIAGWLKVSALVQTGNAEIRGRAAALKEEYYKWFYVILV